VRSGLYAALLAAALSGCGPDSHPTGPSDSAPRAAKRVAGQQNLYVARHQGEEIFRIEATKWRDGHRAAVSITYDAPWGINPVFSLATNAVILRDLRMDIEIVSDKLLHPQRLPIVARMRRELLPNGVHLFGHGHSHIDHDALSYSDAYDAFQTNFALMREWGLVPKVYAYPLYAGRTQQTQTANRAAGFIAARGGTRDQSAYYLCAEDVREPQNWYNLPSVIMGTDSPSDIGDHAELEPILQQTLTRGAWTLMTYHSIGVVDGWGYYPYREFIKDLNFIKRRDFWSGNFDAVAAYIQERNALDIRIARYFGSNRPNQFELVVGDALDNTIFNEPLTLDFIFNAELPDISGVRITPPIGGETNFAVINGQMRLHMVPNERQYTLVLEH
jgi:hypothetical protein